MMLTTKVSGTRLGVAALTCIIATTSADAGTAKKWAKKDHSPLVFDAGKRKKTKTKLTDAISYSAYTSLRFRGERNIQLDDGVEDRSDEFAFYVGLSARATISETVMAFTHAEMDVRKKTTHKREYPVAKKLKVKEALVSFKLSASNTLSLGRMRFSDANKWVADASVDGVHFAGKLGDRAFELAVFKDVLKDGGTYGLLHFTRFSGKNYTGLYALAEEEYQEKRLHIIGYVKKAPTAQFSYTMHAAGVFGDAANDLENGYGFDTRAIRKFDLPGKPQITFGLAAGSDGFRQTGLHGNKTYDGGQTQFHRYGYVYRPELINVAVATLALGLRPSRNFTVDLSSHIYAQPNASTVAPTARVKGATNGTSSFLGSELSLVGAWRPTKKTKVQFGVGVFKPGSAYVNRDSSNRAFARISMYF